jgi:LDH2 family malate/lactate/ureidoglycolate dehydrogenase
LRDARNSGFFFLALNPDVLMPAEAFEARVASLREIVRHSRPAVSRMEVRMPGDRSQQARREHGDEDVLVDAAVHRRLLELTRAA